MKITDLKVNHIAEPMGYETDPVSFSWKVRECKDAKKQKWARILVKKDSEVIYDSSEADLNSLDTQVKIPLCPRTRYQWTVQAAAENGEQAESTSFFETGKMEEAWRAEWITAGPKIWNPESMEGYILEKTFVIDEPMDARFYTCGLGVYEIYINGEKVGDEYLAPGYHSYDLHLQTSTYDVTRYLKKGINQIQIWLGEGWFKSRMGFGGGIPNLYGDRLYAIGEMYLGDALVLTTDCSWISRKSRVVFSGIYDGEIYDARLENAEETGAVECLAPDRTGTLGDRYNLPILKKESFQIKEVLVTPKEETVLDFGQNLTGWVEFDADFPANAAIRLTASEIMQDECFYHENLRLAKTEYIYISSGRKCHVRPMFTFYGFRYMRAEYCEDMNAAFGQIWKPLDPDCAHLHFEAWHLRSDFDQTGFIVTGNKKVNQLFSNALWGQKDNFLDVPTDCPQRDERLGWTGDAQVFSETACYNMYMPAFYRKYLWDMRAEQALINGAVPNVVPRIKEGMISQYGLCPWADAGVIIPWNVYMHYGSKTLLEETYPGMKAWVDYQNREEEKTEGGHLVKGGFHFADWLALDNPMPGPLGATDPLYIASAYYYRDAEIVAESAKILGYEEDAEKYSRLAEEIHQAILETYFDENGLCVSETQTGAALAIMFGIHPEKAIEEGKALSQRVTANQNHLNTGFVGTTMLCPALTETGHHRQAVDLLLNEDYPGWLYSVNLGATTIWERWNSVMPDGHMNPEGMNSLNHYSYGSIEAWMYGYTSGIRALEPGFKKAIIEPHPDERLGYVKCSMDTAAGTYRSDWQYKEGKVSYEIEVPFGGEAKLRLPDGREMQLFAGVYQF